MNQLFSSDEPLEEGVLAELPSDSPPENPKRKSGGKPEAKSLAKLGGRPRVLNFTERVEAWHKHTLGTSIPDLSLEFKTSIMEVQSALELAASELGYPYNHIDPELERFKVVTSDDLMKSSIVKLLDKSHQMVKDLDEAIAELKTDPETGEIRKLHKLTPLEIKSYSVLAETRQLEVRTITSLMNQYLVYNTQIAQLTGINKSKPIRKAKQVVNPEEALEALDEAQLIELVRAGEE